MNGTYTGNFYETYSELSKRSASKVLPHLLHATRAQSVVDVGCGIGTWGSVLLESGISDYLGIDGAYVDSSQLLIPQANFLSADLTLPFKLERTFDLALCLEVGEHLPKAKSDVLVESLCNLSSIIAFSAAIPFQGGNYHVNEQWPEYWAEKFWARGYKAIDLVRPKLWSDPDVEYYYAQNLIVYASETALSQHPALSSALKATDPQALAKVHPFKWMWAHDPQNSSLKQCLKGLIPATVTAFKRKFYSN